MDVRAPPSARCAGLPARSGLLTLEPDGAKRAKYMEFIDIYAKLSENDQGRYRQLYPEEGAMATGFFQRVREEGIEQGIEQGLAQGIEQGLEQGRAAGERAALARLLERRFGVLPPEAAERLRQAPETVLQTWVDNVLDAKTLDEVFRTTPRGTAQAESP